MARLQSLIDQLEAALDAADAAKQTMDMVQQRTAEAIGEAQALFDKEKAEQLSYRVKAEASYAEAVRITEVLKADLRRDFDALMGSGSGGRVRQ